MTQPRTRRSWSEIRTEIYQLLLEDEASSFWSPALILTLFNQQLDLRHMELADRHEGWVTQLWQTDIQKDIPAYAIPEGHGRPKRVMLVMEAGTRQELIIPMARAEKWGQAWAGQQSGLSGRATGTNYTYRMVSEYIVLEPTPSIDIPNGLRADLEMLPQRIVSDGAKLDPRYPAEIETLLVYDTAAAAFAVEGTQGNVPEGMMDHVLRMRGEYAARFAEFTESRTEGRTFSEAFSLGD